MSPVTIKRNFGLHVKRPVFLSDLHRTRRFPTDLPRSPQHQTFDANPYSGRRADTCLQTDMTRLKYGRRFSMVKKTRPKTSMCPEGTTSEVLIAKRRLRFISPGKLYRGKYLTPWPWKWTFK